MSDKMNLDQMMQEALKQQNGPPKRPPTQIPQLVPKAPAASDHSVPGPELTEEAKAAVEYGLVRFNAIADERESLSRQVRELRNEITSLRAANEAGSSQLNEALSRLNTAQMTRDRCVADVAKYEVMFVSFKTQLEAFLSPAARAGHNPEPYDED